MFTRVNATLLLMMPAALFAVRVPYTTTETLRVSEVWCHLSALCGHTLTAVAAARVTIDIEDRTYGKISQCGWRGLRGGYHG